jgi:LacI family transcriptional regulator
MMYNQGMKKPPRVAMIIESAPRYGRGLIRGIVKYSQMHGPWIFPWIFYNDDLGYKERTRVWADPDYIKRWRPDGIITCDFKGVGELIKLNIPLFISVGMTPPDPRWNVITTNDSAIGIMAAEHLLARGFRHFGFCGFDDLVWSRRRCESFTGRIEEAGFKTNVFRQPKSHKAREWYREELILVKWLQDLPKPVGIMACNDRRGQHVTEACARAGLEVPYDVAIVGVDNDDHVCDIINPPLSSVELDVERAGFLSCELLNKMMTGKKLKPQKVVVQPTRVVTRQSTSIIAVEDLLVSQALHFIHQNAKRPIQVNNVAKAVRISRNVLYEKFMKVLKRSVHDEITRVRIAIIGQMLLETDLQISDIAFALGYNSANHISRYFKQRIGISPWEYRMCNREIRRQSKMA